MSVSGSLEDHVFIGIPCYNRPEGLRRTIRCLQQQSHAHWTAVIFENASPNPEISRIATEVCQSDARIRHVRHPENVGAVANFRIAAMNADAEYFLWASDDDLWHPDFLKTNLALLDRHPSAQLACGTIEVINVFDEVLFRCPSFSRFSSGADRLTDAITYLEDPEALGKASLIYGVFRTGAVKPCVERFWDLSFREYYGGDLVFLFAFLTRHPIVTHDEIHMRKRQPTTIRRKIHWRDPRSYRICKSSDLDSYVDRYRQVSPSVDFADIAERILRRRQRERFFYYLPGASSWLKGSKRVTAAWPRMTSQLKVSAEAWG